MQLPISYCMFKIFTQINEEDKVNKVSKNRTFGIPETLRLK